MLAGEGETAQVSWLSGFRHVPLAQVRSWSRQAREVPRPSTKNRFPTRAPRGPSKKSAVPASSGTPGTIHQDPLSPTRKLKKQEMGLGGRQGGQRLGAPCPGPTPEGRLRAEAGAPRPPGSEAEAGPAARLKGRRLEGPRRRSLRDPLREEARRPALSSPPQPRRPPPPPAPGASLRFSTLKLPARAARLTPTNSSNAPEVVSARRSSTARPPGCGAGTGPIRNRARGGGTQGGAAPDGSRWPRPRRPRPAPAPVHARRQPCW